MGVGHRASRPDPPTTQKGERKKKEDLRDQLHDYAHLTPPIGKKGRKGGGGETFALTRTTVLFLSSNTGNTGGKKRRGKKEKRGG